MKRAIGIGLIGSWFAVGAGLAQGPTTPANTKATNEVVQTQTIPEDLRTNMIARFPFDINECSDHTSGFAIPVMFKRESVVYAEGLESGLNVPRLVGGKYGKGLLLEEAYANLFSPNQASVEGDTTGEFIPLKDASLSLTANTHWQGKQSLLIKTNGENGEEGMAVEAKVEKALYNGSAIAPATYVASIYLKGQGNLMLTLKDPASDTPVEPVYVDLTPHEWKRYACSYAFTFPVQSIGAKHDSDWKSLLPPETNLEAKLRFICTTLDKQQAAFYADGLQLEQRQLPYAGNGTGVSPHTWAPGKTPITQEEFSFSTKADFFSAWKKSGTISFWFKPNWDARDGTQEAMLYVGPGVLYLQHARAKIKFSPPAIEFTPYDWKDNWHHIAITWNVEGNRVLYVDGYDYLNAQGEKKPFPPTTDFLAVSYIGNGTSPNGVVDDLILFNGALTLEQIKAIASYDPLNPPKPKPVEEVQLESKPAETPATTNVPTAAVSEEAKPVAEAAPTSGQPTNHPAKENPATVKKEESKPVEATPAGAVPASNQP